MTSSPMWRIHDNLNNVPDVCAPTEFSSHLHPHRLDIGGCKLFHSSMGYPISKACTACRCFRDFSCSRVLDYDSGIAAPTIHIRLPASVTWWIPVLRTQPSVPRPYTSGKLYLLSISGSTAPCYEASLSPQTAEIPLHHVIRSAAR